MTKMGYIFYLVFIVISLVSMFLFDRKVLVGEFALSILFTLLLLYKMWKTKELTTNNKSTIGTKKQHKNYKELIEQKEKEISVLNNTIQWLERKLKSVEGKDKLLSQSTIFRIFQQYLDNPIKNPLTEANWKELTNHLENVIPGFQCLKTGSYKISIDSYRLCVLIRYGFKPTEISILMGKSKSAITKTRKVLLFKIFHTHGNASDFDKKLFDVF